MEKFMISLALPESQTGLCSTELIAVFTLVPIYFSDQIFLLDSPPKDALFSKEIRNSLKTQDHFSNV
jgi:hypothetical protein